MHANSHPKQDGSSAAQQMVADALPAGEASRGSEALYHLIMASLSDGILVLTAEGRVAFCNPAAAEILSGEADVLKGARVHELLGECIAEDCEPLAADRHPLVVALADGQPLKSTVIGLGSPVRWISLGAVFVTDPADGTQRVIVSLADITERKLAQEVLKEAIESIPDGFVVYDHHDRLVSSNKAYSGLYSASSPAIKSGATFESILRFGLERGQYPAAGTTKESKEAWVAERLERHRRPDSGEEIVQQLEDGRWVQIREMVTHSGYLVGFRTDITQIKRQSAALQAAFENFPGGIAYFDENLILRGANSKYRDFMQYPDSLFEKEEVHLGDIFRYNAERGEYGPGDIEELIARRIEFACKPHPHLYEHERPDGLALEVRSTPIPGGGFVFSHMDVSERKSIERALIASERKAREKTDELEVMLANMNQGVSVFDKDGRLTLFNNRYETIFNKESGEAHQGATLEALIAAEKARGDFDGDPARHTRDLMARLSRGEVVLSRFELSDGRVVSSVQAPIPGGGWVGTHEDVTEREKAAAKIAHAATHDILTGLANREPFNRAFVERLEMALATGDTMCVMLIDLDWFKAVNDTHGHAVGDELLRRVADRLRSCIRPTDIVARLGGDEFAVLLSGGSELRETAAAVAARLVRTLSAPYEIDGKSVEIGASVGVAVAPENGNSADTLQKNADSALYKVKAEGRNSFRFFDDLLKREVDKRRRLEGELRRAIAEGALVLHYQPIFGLEDNCLLAVEACPRWMHPDEGSVAPEVFMPLAEETGLITALEAWMLKQACLDASSWPLDIKVVVDVSATQLGQGRLVEATTGALLASGIDPERLQLDIPEAALSRDDDAVLQDLHQIRALGVSIALADFGSGMASLRSFHRFPFDLVKIDRTFITSIDRDAQSAAIVCSVANLAESMNIAVAAVGIETAEQAALLFAAGTSQGQGPYLGDPAEVGRLNFGEFRAGLPLGGWGR